MQNEGQLVAIKIFQFKEDLANIGGESQGERDADMSSSS